MVGTELGVSGSFFPIPWSLRTFPTPLTGLSTYIQFCKDNELLEYLKRHSVIVQSIDYEEYAIHILLSNHNNDLSDNDLMVLVNNYLRSIAQTFQLIALPDTALSVPFYELHKMISKICNRTYTLYFSIPLNIVFYCGPSDYYVNALADINGFISSTNLNGESLFSQNRSVHSIPIDPIINSNTVFSDSHSIQSSQTSYASVHIEHNSVCCDDENTLNNSLYCNGQPSPIYSNVFQKLPWCTRFVIGNGSELVDFVIVFRGTLIRDRLPPQFGQVRGFYYNRSGWYVMVQESSKDTAAALQSLYLDVSKDIQFTHRKKLQLHLNEKEFIQKLISVSELALKNIAIHQVNERDVILLGNEPWFSRIKLMLTPEDQTVLLPQETQPLLSSMENLVKPVCGVNSVELQTIWTEEYAARGLDRQPIGFACFLTRCRRQELLQFVQTSLAIPNEKITNIIHCNEGFFLVFEKKVVPNRDRWKKYKNRIIPEIFNIEYCCVPAKTPSSDDSFEELRDHIEKISNGNATVHWEERQLYIVGESSAISSIQQEKPDYFENSNNSFVFSTLKISRDSNDI